jgi:hypothetical protein
VGAWGPWHQSAWASTCSHARFPEAQPTFTAHAVQAKFPGVKPQRSNHACSNKYGASKPTYDVTWSMPMLRVTYGLGCGANEAILVFETQVMDKLVQRSNTARIANEPKL